MADRKIVIVTGCRDWDWRDAVWLPLMADGMTYADFHVFSGDCPTGADEMVREFMNRTEPPCATGAMYHRICAEWASFGRSAGPRRNGAMLKRAQQLQESDESGETELECLAFWDGKSRGTLDCIKQATAMGIPVRVVPRTRAKREILGEETRG